MEGLEIHQGGKLTHRSVSQLTTYARCSEAYRLERVEKVQPAPAGWTIHGIAVHRAIEVWEKSGRSMSLAAAQAVFLKEWEAGIEQGHRTEPDLNRWLRGGRRKTETDLAQRREAGLHQVEEYIAYTQESPFRVMEMPDGSPAVEVGFRVELDGVEVVGYIDQILEHREDGALLLCDVKTGSKPTWPLQLGVYRLAMEDCLGIDIAYGAYYMAKSAELTKPMDLAAAYPRDLVSGWFRNLDAGVRSGTWIPSPGDACFPCGVKHACAAYQGLSAAA